LIGIVLSLMLIEMAVMTATILRFWTMSIHLWRFFGQNARTIASALICVAPASVLCSHALAEDVKPCSWEQLKVASASADSAMSKAEVTFIVRNETATPCSLRGAPKVEAHDKSGAPVHLSKNPTPNEYQEKSQRLLLAEGEQATFSVSFGTSNGYPSGQCPDHAAYLLVRLPEVTDTKKIDIDLDICTKVHVSPFRSSGSR
jgi:hypothetical protein